MAIAGLSPGVPGPDGNWYRVEVDRGGQHFKVRPPDEVDFKLEIEVEEERELEIELKW